MKYIFRILFVAFSISTFCFGQTDSIAKTKKVNLYSKRGVYILPEKGEIGVGIDAYPIFYYIGGLFSNANATPPSFNYADGGTNAIYAKYMLKQDMAIRIHFRFDFSTDETIYTVPKSTLTYDPQRPEFVDDLVTTQNNNITLGIGVEKHRGKGRVQGIYGAEVFYAQLQGTTAYNYGNDITNEFNTPQTFNNNYNNGERIIDDNYRKAFSIGGRGFLGVEYFIAPKISLGGEFGYSLFYSWGQNRIQTYEYWNAALSKVSNVVRKSTLNGSNNMNFNIDHLDGSINIFFYF